MPFKNMLQELMRIISGLYFNAARVPGALKEKLWLNILLAHPLYIISVHTFLMNVSQEQTPTGSELLPATRGSKEQHVFPGIGVSLWPVMKEGCSYQPELQWPQGTFY